MSESIDTIVPITYYYLMATNNNTNGAAKTPTLTKWNGLTVAFNATPTQAKILGYMWDAQERTRGSK